MKKKILDLAKSAVWFVLCLLVGALTFEGVCSLANRKEPAKYEQSCPFFMLLKS